MRPKRDASCASMAVVCMSIWTCIRSHAPGGCALDMMTWTHSPASSRSWTESQTDLETNIPSHRKMSHIPWHIDMEEGGDTEVELHKCIYTCIQIASICWQLITSWQMMSDLLLETRPNELTSILNTELSSWATASSSLYAFISLFLFISSKNYN